MVMVTRDVHATCKACGTQTSHWPDDRCPRCGTPYGLLVHPGTVVHTRWDMQPRPAARHRTGRFGNYVPAQVLEAQAQVALLHEPHRGTFPKGVQVAVELQFYCHRWRGDADNLAKLVMDALRDHRLGKLRDGAVLQGAGVYHDDRQVRRLVVQWDKVPKDVPEGVRLHMRVFNQEAP